MQERLSDLLHRLCWHLPWRLVCAERSPSSRDSGPLPPPKMPAHALFAAMQAQDEQAPLSILGPAAKDVLSSGDPAEDSDARVGFVVKYQEMHRFVTEANGTVTLVVGAENWPLSDSLGEQPRLVVFRHRRRQRRNPIPSHRQK